MADYSSTVQNATPAQPSTFAPVAAAALGAGVPVAIDASSKQAVKARANSATTAVCVGLTTAPVAAGDNAIVKYGDILRLTEDQWDQVTGDTGGLTAGATYYVDAATAGLISDTPPASEGSFVVPVGTAVSSTELLVLLTAIPALL